MSELRGGIDLGGTKIQTAIVDAGGEVLGEARRPTPTDGGPAGVAEQMAEALREAATAAGVAPAALEGVGVGSPGDADEKTGVVSSAKNLPDWEGSFPLGETLAQALGTEVRVGNDVQVATEAEFHLGAGREFQSLIGVFWGTGVGGGLVLNGKPWLGRGAAGEIGHMVVKRGGAKCPCGRKGCMEAYAGRSAMEAEARRQHEEGHKTDLFKLMEKHGKPRLTSGIWERAIDHNDHLAVSLIDRAIEALGTGVASAVNLIDPEAIIIGGGLGIRFGERYMEPLMAEMGKHLFLDQKPPAVRVASLGDLGGAVGASLLFAR
ncbi:MAG TPA: ROK family protein [Solirubrobacterales bacterium]|nr:ROK family protein [Solirubrobacterales bacterium]